MKLPLISNPALSPLPPVLQAAILEHLLEKDAAFWAAPSRHQSLDTEDEAPANMNVPTQPWEW